MVRKRSDMFDTLGGGGRPLLTFLEGSLVRPSSRTYDLICLMYDRFVRGDFYVVTKKKKKKDI